MNGPQQNSPTGVSLALRALARFPERVAFRSARGDLTYAQAARLIGGMQASLRAHGLQVGDRAVVLAANTAESWCATQALSACGVAVSLMHPIGSLAAHLNQIAELKAGWVIVDAAQHAERATELRAQAPQAQHFSIGDGQASDLLVLAAAQADAAPSDDSDPAAPCALNFTGGTTGKPKCVVRSGAGVGQITLAILQSFELPECPQYLAVAPISHVAGTKIVPVLMRGGTVHLMQGFDAGAVLAAMEAQRINMTLLVPTMIYALLDHAEIGQRDLSSLELLLYGASPMAPSRLAQGIAVLGPVFAQLYGQTECYPIAYRARADHDLSEPEGLDACGHPVAAVSVRLLNDAGEAVAAGEPGEICVRGAQVMDTYLNRPEEVAVALAGDWLHTGDIAVADARGRLTIVDRKKDMIVSGGFNVFPSEVEHVLMSHPDVAQAAVIGVPDDKWGEAVMAYVVRRPGSAVDDVTLGDLVKAHKGAVYRPKRFEWVDALPLTPVGKIDKPSLRAPHWAGRTRQV